MINETDETKAHPDQKHTEREDWKPRFKDRDEHVTAKSEKNYAADDDGDGPLNDDREKPLTKDGK